MLKNKKRLLANSLIVIGLFLILSYAYTIFSDEIWYNLKQLKKQNYFLPSSVLKLAGINANSVDPVNFDNDSVFARYISVKPVSLVPVNTDFSLVIEKIGVNVPVVSGVVVSDPKAYAEALKSGVAQALVSDLPSTEPGNVYLFAHSSINFWQLGKYATTFNLLRKLSVDDPIYIFYHNRTYKYKVVNKETVRGWNTYPLSRKVIEPILTLQTCDPPGTTFNRLIVTAKLVDYTKNND